MRRSVAAVGTAGLLGLVSATAGSPAQAQEGGGEATLSVLHGVPGLTVDVYANGEELIANFAPGTLTDPLTLPAGTYDLQAFPDGEGPDGDPAIEAQGVQVPGGANATVVAHLDADGNPALTPFVNDISQTAPGEGRLTVRHTAAAPAVDVIAEGEVLISDLSNPNEASAELPAGAYSAEVAPTGTQDPVLGPADVEVTEGMHTIVYAWGSADQGNLDLAVQTIDGLHSAPGGVPGGEAGLAPESDGVPAWALGLGLMSALALAYAGRQLVPARSRR